MPHVTLKSIANNPDIKEGMTREQIDAAIAQARRNRNAVRPALRGQGHRPRDRAVHRREPVAAPHAAGRGDATATRPPQAAAAATGELRDHDPRQPPQGRRAEHGQERTAHVRPARPFPGEYIQAEGTYTETAASKAVRVSIGPEFGTVGRAGIKKAALEAIKGSRCDLLLVCGFAFDPHVHEQTQELTKEMQVRQAARCCPCG